MRRSKALFLGAFFVLSFTFLLVNNCFAEPPVGKLSEMIMNGMDKSAKFVSLDLGNENSLKTAKGDVKYWQATVAFTVGKDSRPGKQTVFIFQLPEGCSFAKAVDGWVIAEAQEDIRYIVEFGAYRQEVKHADSLARNAGSQAESAQDFFHQERGKYTCKLADLIKMNKYVGDSIYKDVVFTFDKCDKTEFHFTTKHKKGEETFSWTNK